VSRSRLCIIRGEKARRKLVRIADTSPEALRTCLQGVLPGLAL
jgi:uncharacterized protein YggU (UPF0235/DUF167 family)